MAKTKTIYIADDGKEFDNEAACDAHNTYLAEKAKIEEFIAAMKLHKVQAGLMRRLLPAYISFLSTGKVPGAEEE